MANDGENFVTGGVVELDLQSFTFTLFSDQMEFKPETGMYVWDLESSLRLPSKCNAINGNESGKMT